MRSIARPSAMAAALLLVAASSSGAREAPETLVLAGLVLHDGSGNPPIPDAVIVVAGGRFLAVGPRGQIEMPADARVVEFEGNFAIPGLIDTHVHYSQTGWIDGRPDASDVRDRYPYPAVIAELRDHPERFHRAFLHAGVTAVFDVGGFPWTRQLGRATEDSPHAPHVASAGPLLATYVPPELQLADERQMVLVEDEDGARGAVRSHAMLGSRAIKFWFIVRSDAEARERAPLVLAAGDEARRAGLPLVVHATTLETARIAVEAGASLLVHSVEDREVDDAFVRAAAKSGVSYCPTLVVHEGYRAVFAREVPEEVARELESADPWVEIRVRETASLERPSWANEAALERLAAGNRLRDEIMAANLLSLHEAGVPIVLGTDAGNPLTLHGPSVFAEADAMAKAGLAPSAILLAATRDAARAIGRGGDLGFVAAGRIADLVVLARDPAAAVENLRSITHVLRAGVLHAREDLRPR